MRSFLCILLALFLASCQKSYDGLSCTNLHLAEMTAEQQTAAMEFCSEEIKVEEANTMVRRIEREAEVRGQTIDQFVETRLGAVMLIKELSAVVIALITIIGFYLIAMIFMRATAWEEEKATRKKWGPFSYWEIEYVRRKDNFLDIPTVGWLFMFGILSLMVGLGLYASLD